MNGLQSLFMSWVFPWVPKRLLSRLTGMWMRVPLFWPLKVPLLRGFARAFGIDAGEAELPLSAYHSLDDFFTRKLKPGLRPVEGPWVHPADSRLTERGRIQQGQLIQAKGWTYSAAEFLGDAELAKLYVDGTYLTYYLCPADYHRVHAPTSGQLTSACHIPGMLWPVNQWSVTNIRRLFCLNERVVLNFTSPQGRWSLVMVGATNVGYMTITHDPSIATNRWLWHAPTNRAYAPPIAIQAGDELGMFHLGSTVICLFEKGLLPRVSEGPSVPVKMGCKL
jgi:phosphatidylserine decarboxylase